MTGGDREWYWALAGCGPGAEYSAAQLKRGQLNDTGKMPKL